MQMLGMKEAVVVMMRTTTWQGCMLGLDRRLLGAWVQMQVSRCVSLTAMRLLMVQRVQTHQVAERAGVVLLPF
jgi:hypothetical protein